VARSAGVSLATASRALNPETNHPVRAATRERVLKAAAELAYEPNLMARGLRSRRLPTIGVLVHDIGDPYFTEIVRGAAHEASMHGYLTFVGSSERDADAELRYVDMLRLSRVSAILFAGGELNAAHYRRGLQGLVQDVREYGGVVVALAPRREKWPTEITDNRGGARLMTEHLLKLGHRRIAFVAGPDYVLTSGDREAGYREAMDKAGEQPLVERSDFTIESGAAATAALLDSHQEFTALFLTSDTIAIGALAELRRRNVRVPDDLSVAGFGGEPAWVHGDPGLTTVETRLEEIGAAGVRRAIAELAGHPSDPRVHVHAATILERGSTRPVRETARH
jgi:LacI family transcriptional regulator